MLAYLRVNQVLIQCCRSKYEWQEGMLGGVRGEAHFLTAVTGKVPVALSSPVLTEGLIEAG